MTDGTGCSTGPASPQREIWGQTGTGAAGEFWYPLFHRMNPHLVMPLGIKPLCKVWVCSHTAPKERKNKIIYWGFQAGHLCKRLKADPQTCPADRWGKGAGEFGKYSITQDLLQVGVSSAKILLCAFTLPLPMTPKQRKKHLTLFLKYTHKL